MENKGLSAFVFAYKGKLALYAFAFCLMFAGACCSAAPAYAGSAPGEALAAGMPVAAPSGEAGLSATGAADVLYAFGGEELAGGAADPALASGSSPVLAPDPATGTDPTVGSGPAAGLDSAAGSATAGGPAITLDPAATGDPIDGVDPAVVEDPAVAGGPVSATGPVAGSTGSDPVLVPLADPPSLKVGDSLLYDGTTVFSPLTNAIYTLANNTFTLIGIDLPTDTSQIDDPSDIPAITALGNIVAKGLGSTFKILLQKNVIVADSDDADDVATIDVTGDLTVAGGDGSQLVVIGTIATKADIDAGANGDLTLESGGLTVISFSKDASDGSKDAVACIGAAGNVTFNGGTATLLGLGSGPAINAGGDFTQTDGGFNQILALGDAAVNVGGDVTISGGQALFMGLGGSGMNVTGDGSTVILSGGQAQFLGILDQQNAGGSAPAPTCGLYIKDGNLFVQGGSHQVIGVGMNDADKGLFVGNGDNATPANGSVTISDGSLFVLGAMGDGLIAKGFIDVSDGKLDGSGNYAGIHSDKDIMISGGAVNAFATGKCDTSGIDWQKIMEELKNAKTIEDYLKIFAEIGNIQKSENNRKGYALTADGDIIISDGTVTAMAFNTATAGVGNEMIAIHAGGDVAISGGTVVALADTKGANSTAIGIHAGTTDAAGAPVKSGRIDITGGTTTAYAFGNATRHLSMYVEPDATNGSRPERIAVAPALKLATGSIAPGAQIAAAGYTKDTAPTYPYAYITDGRLYLDDIYVKWDDMGQELVQFIVGFDGENGKLKMTREMMQTLIGLDRTVIIASDNVDLAGSTWSESLGIAAMRSMALCSDISDFVIYYSAMFKGMGVVFIFQNGMLNNNVSTIHQVAGVDVYDFGTRYNTDPEHAMFLGLVGDRLIHSIHFNYRGEFPATMTLLMAVGEGFIGETVSWYWRNAATGELIWIGDYKVDPFGWISVADQTVSYGETALLRPAARFVATGDALPWQLRVLVPLLLAGLILVVMSLACRKRASAR